MTDFTLGYGKNSSKTSSNESLLVIDLESEKPKRSRGSNDSSPEIRPKKKRKSIDQTYFITTYLTLESKRILLTGFGDEDETETTSNKESVIANTTMPTELTTTVEQTHTDEEAAAGN